MYASTSICPYLEEVRVVDMLHLRASPNLRGHGALNRLLAFLPLPPPIEHLREHSSKALIRLGCPMVLGINSGLVSHRDSLGQVNQLTKGQ